MRTGAAIVSLLLFSGLLFCACGGGGGSASAPGPSPAATPVISTAGAQNGAQNGAQLASISDASSGATIYYTLDGSTPTTASPIYQAPILIASSMTVSAIATASGFATSSVASRQFAVNVSSGTQVWSEEFSNAGTSPAQPDANTWTYDTGYQCCGNQEQETYCAWGATGPPCATAYPNAYVGTDGYLHIIARNPSPGAYTSSRLKSQGLFSFMYGRIEARMKLPESQAMWPAFWLLGNNIATVNWPACGELDVMEHIDGSNPGNKGYDWVQSSVHGTGLDGGQPYTAPGFSAAGWHTYGMIWSKGQVQFYIDDPAHPYETFTPANITGTWPFDQGPQFIILNLAVGGTWPGNVDNTTVFPSEMLVDYVRIFTN